MRSSVIDEIRQYAMKYKKNTGDNLRISNNNIYCICGESISLLYVPSRKQVFPVDVEYNHGHFVWEEAKIHECLPMPSYKCKNCKDKGFTLINLDRTGQDSDIRKIPCKH